MWKRFREKIEFQEMKSVTVGKCSQLEMTGDNDEHFEENDEDLNGKNRNDEDLKNLNDGDQINDDQNNQNARDWNEVDLEEADEDRNVLLRCFSEGGKK